MRKVWNTQYTLVQSPERHKFEQIASWGVKAVQVSCKTDDCSLSKGRNSCRPTPLHDLRQVGSSDNFRRPTCWQYLSRHDGMLPSFDRRTGHVRKPPFQTITPHLRRQTKCKAFVRVWQPPSVQTNVLVVCQDCQVCMRRGTNSKG